MSRNNVNIMVFDEESVITDQSRVNTNNVRRGTFDAYSSNQPQAVIQTQISQLNKKISYLQQKAQKIQQMIRSNSCNPSLSQINTTINVSPINSMHIEELLKVVEQKIQIVVQETKKIIQKMNGQFQKRINKTVSQKNHYSNSIEKNQAHCRDAIVKVEQSYQEEINLVRNQHVHLEKRLLQRVQNIQNQYKKRLKDFQSKQQQYIATIQHLENKLRMSSRSSKKIQVTAQQKPPTASMKSIKTDPADNMSNYSSQNVGSVALPVHDTSKRRAKIFQGRGSNKSISPNNQVLSPLKAQNNGSRVQTQSLANHNNQQMSKQSRQAATVVPITNNYMPQQKLQNYHIKATVIPESANTNMNMNTSTNKNMNTNTNTNMNANMNANMNMNMNMNIPKLAKQPQKSRRSEQQMPRNIPSEKQFLKDAPKPHWERFQDFNQNDSSGSEEDVFFYPEHHDKEEPKSVFDYEKSGSMHSPFDLN